MRLVLVELMSVHSRGSAVSQSTQGCSHNTSVPAIVKGTLTRANDPCPAAGERCRVAARSFRLDLPDLLRCMGI